MATSRTAAKSLEGARMWDTDPRMKKILAQPVGSAMDLSVFTEEEIDQLFAELSGSNPELPDPPKAELFL